MSYMLQNMVLLDIPSVHLHRKHAFCSFWYIPSIIDSCIEALYAIAMGLVGPLCTPCVNIQIYISWKFTISWIFCQNFLRIYLLSYTVGQNGLSITFVLVIAYQGLCSQHCQFKPTCRLPSGLKSSQWCEINHTNPAQTAVVIICIKGARFTPES